MTDEEKTAACLLLLFAAIAYDGERREGAWYRWCIERGAAARTPLERMVWWAMRFRARDEDDDWIGYLEYKARTVPRSRW